MSKLIGLKNDERIFRILEMTILVLTGVFIFIIPFPYHTAIQEICFYLSIFLVLILFLYKKRELSFKSPLTVPFILFFMWAVVSLPAALNKQNTLNDIYAHLLKHMAIFYLVANFFSDRKRFVILTWILMISASLFSIGGIIYFYVISGNDLSIRLGLPEVGIGVNYIGFFTVTAILFSLTHFIKEVDLPFKATAIVCALASSIATILTGTRGTFLGLILPLLLLFPRYKKTMTAFALIFLVIIGFTPVKDIFTPESLLNKLREDERKEIWYTYLVVMKDHPITGIGYGMQTYNKNLLDEYNLKISPQYQIQSSGTSPFYAPHNTFLDVTVRLGVVGLALFLYIVFIFARMGWQLMRYGRGDFIKTWALCLTAVFVSFLIQGMFADLLLGVQIIIFFIILAMMTVLWRFNEEYL